MKKTIVTLVLAIAFISLSYGAYSQNAMTFLSHIVSGDTINSKSEFIRMYKSSDAYEQQTLRQNILNELEKQLTNENRQSSMNLVSLYLSVCDTDDISLPVVLYISGENYAYTGDTTNLKVTITKLEKIAKHCGDPLSVFLNPLNDYLARLRNSVPKTESLEGFWIANFIMDERNIGQEGAPYLIMRIKNEGESMRVEILPCSFVANKISTYVPGIEGRFSQIIKPFSKDSLYICWSSSRIVNKSDLGVTALRMTTNELSSNVIAKYSQRNKYSFSEQLTASLATSAIEMGVNALLDEIFMPKKKDFVLEARLQIKNDYMIEGTLHYSSSVLRADGKSKNKEIVLYSGRFAKWMPESDIVFSTTNRKPILPDDRDPKAYRKDTTTYFHNAFLSPKNKSDKYVYRYNLLELGRLGLYLDSLLLTEGNQESLFIYDMDNIWKTKTFCGFTCIDITPETKKKYSLKVDSGVMVYSIIDYYPSYFSIMNRGDVIISIDGTPIKNSEDLSNIEFINNKLTTFEIIRGRKKMTVKIKPFFYIFNYRDQNNLTEEDLKKLH